MKVTARQLAMLIDALDTHSDELWKINPGGTIDPRWNECKKLRDELMEVQQAIEVPVAVVPDDGD